MKFKLVSILALCISANISLAEPVKYSSIDQLPVSGAVEAIFEGKFYIMSSYRQVIPKKGVTRIEGEQIALSIAMMKADAQLAKYVNSNVGSSSQLGTTVEILGDEANTKIKKREVITSKSKDISLKKIKTLGEVIAKGHVKVVRAIQKEDLPKP